MPANHDRDESVTSPRHPVGKKPLRVRVIFLDGRAENFLLSPRCPGQEFFDLVVQKLQLDDTDYFDLEYEDSLGNRCWLDHFKPLYKPVSQISRRPALFSFKVKFYTPNLSLLSNRLTRRLFALQIKRDLIDGELHCGENTGALLAAFILQAEFGDHEDEEERKVISHLEKLRLNKLFSPAFVSKVMDLHSNLTGMSQSEADYRLLDTARKVEFYGLKLQPAKDHGGLSVNLGVTHAGLFLYQGNMRINAFSWSKIRKLSFKRSKFLIKLHSGSEVTGRETIDFYFNSRNSCKNFWKKCLEHHAFFRSRDVHGVAGQGSGGLGSAWSAPATHPYASQPLLLQQSARAHSSREGLNGGAPSPITLNRSNSLTSRRGQNIFSKGSSYRYFGRTHQQLLEDSQSTNGYGVTADQRSRSVGLLGAGLSLPYPGSPNPRRNSAGFGGLDGPELPCNGLRRCWTGFGSSLSTVAGLSTDFGNSSLPDHYRLLLLSTPIHRPFSARSRTASSPSVDRSSLNTGSTLGSTLMEAEAGCQVPRVFSVNALKLRSQVLRGKKQNNGAPVNNETSVDAANNSPAGVNGDVTVLVDANRTADSSSDLGLQSPLGKDHKMNQRTEDGEKNSASSHEANSFNGGACGAFSAESGSRVSESPLTSVKGENDDRCDHVGGGATSNAVARHVDDDATAATAAAVSSGSLGDISGGPGTHSIPSCSLEGLRHDEDEETETDANSRYSAEYEDDDDDSLLQHPLSVCASRAASVCDLYEAEPVALEYPMCHLDSSPESSYSSTGEREEVRQQEKNERDVNSVITSPQAADSSSPDKDGVGDSPTEPSKPALTSNRMDNSLLGLSTCPEVSQEAKFIEAHEAEGDTDRSSEGPNSILPALSMGAISAITGVSCYDDDDDDVHDVSNYYVDVDNGDAQGLAKANDWSAASGGGGAGAYNCSQPMEFPPGWYPLQLPAGRPAPPSLPSLSPTRLGPFTGEERQGEVRGRVRALSESCNPPGAEGAVDTSCLVSPMPSMMVATLSGPSNRRIQAVARVHKRRRRRSKRPAPTANSVPAKPIATCAPALEDAAVNFYLPTPVRQPEASALIRPGRPVSRILRKKLVPPYHDRTFHLAKELSMTERTYVKSLRLLLMPSLEDQSPEVSRSLLLRLISPIYETHVAITSAAFARLVAWEKAAVAAAAARTRYQFAVANAHLEQRRRREYALRHMQARLHEVTGRPEDPAATQQRMRSLSASSSSSNSVSGIPRSASFRHELPASELPVPPVSAGQQSASSRYLMILSSPTSSSEEEAAVEEVATGDCQSGCVAHDFSSNSCPPHLTACSPTISCSSSHVCSERIPPVAETRDQGRRRTRHDELPSAEVELRDTTRCLAGLARIADVYREALMSVLPLYEVYMTNFFRLLMETGSMGSAAVQTGGIGTLAMPSPPTDHDATGSNYLVRSSEDMCASDAGMMPMKPPQPSSLPLPSTNLLLCQPARRLRCLLNAFIRLSNLYPEDHLDRADCIVLITHLQKTISKSESIYRAAEAYLLTSEFCPDLHHLHFPVLPAHIMNGERTFIPGDPVVNQRNLRDCLSFIARSNETSSLIRVGYLQKLSKRGFQARMALLFSDRLVCCGRTSGSRSIRLKIRGSISLRNARLEPRMVPSASFCSATGSYPDCLDSNTRRVSGGDAGRGQSTPNPAGHYRHCFTLLGVAEELDCVTFSSCCLLTENTTTGTPSRSQAVHRVRRFVFAAPSDAQKELWLADISNALSRLEMGDGPRSPCQHHPQQQQQQQQQRHHSIDALINPADARYPEVTLDDTQSVFVQRSKSTTEIATHQDNESDMCDAYLGLLGPRSHAQQTLLRCNPLLYVCWHRRLTVSLDSVLNANECELSGHLLRKFKNSCGWQKLWTVFTDFTLFFFKSADDHTPLACLPLLGYCLESARVSDHDLRTHKPDVLRLSYKSHVYFFRTDGPISFQRWYTALSSALHFLSVSKQFPESD